MYYLFKLEFVTPVRFGNEARGAGLEKMRPTAHADTLFSALCNEAALQSKECVETLIEAVQADKVGFSDLFPYYQEELYLPKPILKRQEPQSRLECSSEEIRDKAKLQKKLKKLQYIAINNFEKYLQGLKTAQIPEFSEPDFGVPLLTQRVNKRGRGNQENTEPLPYVVSAFQFKDNCGLYFVLKADEKNLAVIKNLLVALGYSGIGGKRTSGYGKFIVKQISQLALATINSEQKLYKMLINEQAKTQMALAVLTPKAQELSLIKQGNYLIIARSGFISSPEFKTQQKRESIYMLAPGSCLPKRAQGEFNKIQTLAHPVYRYAKGMFVGLDI